MPALAWAFEFVEDGDGEILGRDSGRAVGADDQCGGAAPVLSGPLSGLEQGGRAEIDPGGRMRPAGLPLRDAGGGDGANRLRDVLRTVEDKPIGVLRSLERAAPPTTRMRDRVVWAASSRAVVVAVTVCSCPGPGRVAATIASTPSNSSLIRSASFASPSTAEIPGGKGVGGRLRNTATISWPRRTASAMTREPTMPLAPTTAIFISVSLRGSIRRWTSGWAREAAPRRWRRARARSLPIAPGRGSGPAGRRRERRRPAATAAREPRPR